MKIDEVISAVIPVFNEEENIPILNGKLIDVFDRLKCNFEIIYVDDGSTDGSRDILRALARSDNRVRPVFFKKNCGQTAAIDAGFKAAKGELVVTLDADLQNDPEDIKLLLDTMKTERYDTVVGWRFERQDSLVKKISSKIANAVRNWLSDEDIADTGCSLKLFKKECLDSIKLFRGMHRFLPTLIKMEGYKVGQVKVSHHHRKYGTSKYGIGNRLFSGLRDLFAVRWMKDRNLNYEIEDEENI